MHSPEQVPRRCIGGLYARDAVRYVKAEHVNESMHARFFLGFENLDRGSKKLTEMPVHSIKADLHDPFPCIANGNLLKDCNYG